MVPVRRAPLPPPFGRRYLPPKQVGGTIPTRKSTDLSREPQQTQNVCEDMEADRRLFRLGVTPGTDIEPATGRTTRGRAQSRSTTSPQTPGHLPAKRRSKRKAFARTVDRPASVWARCDTPERHRTSNGTHDPRPCPKSVDHIKEKGTRIAADPFQLASQLARVLKWDPSPPIVPGCERWKVVGGASDSPPTSRATSAVLVTPKVQPPSVGIHGSTDPFRRVATRL